MHRTARLALPAGIAPMALATVPAFALQDTSQLLQRQHQRALVTFVLLATTAHQSLPIPVGAPHALQAPTRAPSVILLAPPALQESSRQVRLWCACCLSEAPARPMWSALAVVRCVAPASANAHRGTTPAVLLRVLSCLRATYLRAWRQR